MAELAYRYAVSRALAEEMERDPSVVMLGEDIGAAGGVFKATEGLFERFGGDRVRDTPISEQAIIGAAVGASLLGMRPVAELMFADFAGVAFDQLVNQLAKYRYTTDGQFTLPVTVRLVNGAGTGFGSQHSQPVENWFMNVPGLQIVVPGTPRDVVGLLKSSIRSDDPVLFFEHKGLYNVKGEVDDALDPIPLGVADIVRSGGDVTIVATQRARIVAEEAAVELAGHGIEATVIDPRCLVPFDFATVRESLERTGRLVVVQESSFSGSWGATLVARVAVECLDLLDAEPVVVGAPDVPVPFAQSLEERWMPDVRQVVGAASKLTAV
jgi:pyruvate dehydrogenase E1 component beta subunit